MRPCRQGELRRSLGGTRIRPADGRHRVEIFPLSGTGGSGYGRGLSLQTRDSLTRFGAKAMLPAVIVFSLIKESGPVITALIVSGRVGAGIGAELGSMRVTEQIDAMEVSAVNPYKFLASTRVLACLLYAPFADAHRRRFRHLPGMGLHNAGGSP